MKIRKATQTDMPFVLNLIRELAAFEREPEAVVVTVDDLIRDGFSEPPWRQDGHIWRCIRSAGVD